MKKFSMLLFAIIGIVLATLTSCEDKYVSEGRKMYMQYFKKTLVDPESFKVYEETYTADGLKVDWLLDYGAKNRKGELVREVKQVITYYPDMIKIDGELKSIQ